MWPDRVGEIAPGDGDSETVINSRDDERRDAEEKVAVPHRMTPDSFRNAAVSLPKVVMKAAYSSCGMKPGCRPSAM